LLVPPEKEQLNQVKGDKRAYDSEPRPRLMVQTIQELQDAEEEPDVSKIEGLDRREFVDIFKNARAKTRAA
jgi:hypothetical protein